MGRQYIYWLFLFCFVGAFALSLFLFCLTFAIILSSHSQVAASDSLEWYQIARTEAKNINCSPFIGVWFDFNRTENLKQPCFASNFIECFPDTGWIICNENMFSYRSPKWFVCEICRRGSAPSLQIDGGHEAWAKDDRWKLTGPIFCKGAHILDGS